MKYRDFTTKELRWMESFDKVMKKAPKGLFMFVGAGITIHPLCENGCRYMTELGGVDQKATSHTVITPMSVDGGDY